MSKIFLFFCLISLIFTKGPYQMENDVIVLNERTFGFALREFKYLLILFYDPECPFCQNFLPEYSNIATILKEENFVFAKLDCKKYQRLETLYEIEVYPTLMLFKDNQKIIFDGQRNLEEIKKWLEEKTKPKFIEINNKKELDNFSKLKLCMVYFGTNETTINEIIIAERKFETMPLGIVSNEDLIKSEAPKDKKDEKKEFKEYINIYKNFDDKKNTLKGKLSAKNIYRFAYTYCYPKVIEFTDETAPIIFAKRQPALVIFGSKTGKERNPKDYNDSLNLLRYMWPQIKDKIRLFVCDINGLMASQMAKYCGINYNNIPKVFIVHAENESPKKYEMKGGINEENILYFINQWKQGKLTPYIRSEPVPKNNKDEVFKLVGYTFEKEVIKNDKDVLVYFVSPDCKKCKEFEPELVNLSKKLKKFNDKILIAKMDATLNDVDQFQIHSFPTIIFYPGNAKDDEPIELKGRKNSIELIEKFILKHAYHKYTEEEKNPDL